MLSEPWRPGRGHWAHDEFQSGPHPPPDTTVTQSTDLYHDSGPTTPTPPRLCTPPQRFKQRVPPVPSSTDYGRVSKDVSTTSPPPCSQCV